MDIKKKPIIKHNPNTARFREAEWYNPGLDVIVGGAGGISSYLCFFLGRIECNINLFEFDIIEAHNLGGQLYANNSIGKTKGDEVSSLIKNYTSGSLIQHGKFNENSPISPIVFSGFDNMTVRKLMFQKWKEQEDREIFIDGRMSAEDMEVYAVLKGQEELYEATLFDDNEVEDAPCNFKATSHCGAIIAGIMTSVFNNYMGNKKTNMDVREIPFKTEIHLSLMKFDTYDGTEVTIT